MENRVIKFRAWDGDKMWHQGDAGTSLVFFGQPDKIPFGVYDTNGLHRIMTGDPNAVFNTPSILMQFTGLTDKNGVEIYEGDVVEKCYGSSVKTGVVAWHQERAMFILQDGFNEPLYQLPLNMIEAIGNVFENPELLNP